MYDFDIISAAYISIIILYKWRFRTNRNGEIGEGGKKRVKRKNCEIERMKINYIIRFTAIVKEKKTNYIIIENE